jgi:hypothetical protein
MQNNQNNHVKGRFAVEERRRQIALLLARSKTEMEIASLLGVECSTISRDIKALREMSRQFVFDLAKSDLAYYYKQCIDGIEYVLRRASDMIDSGLTAKYELLALRLIKECNEAKFNLFERGPSIMNVRMLEERLTKIEDNGNWNGKKQEYRSVSQ